MVLDHLGHDEVEPLLRERGVEVRVDREVAQAGDLAPLAIGVGGRQPVRRLQPPDLLRELEALGARIVSLGSLSTLLSTFRIDDLQLERGYDSWRAYAQSKIATQVFAFELDRRLRAAGVAVSSVVAHPGYSIRGRTPTVPGVNEPSRGDRFADALQGAWAQGKHRGAEVSLHALTAAEVTGGQFWGPRHLTRGEPALQHPSRVTTNQAIGARFWAFAEGATGGAFPVGG